MSRNKVFLVIVISLLILLSACITSSSNKKAPKVVYVTPCNVAGKGVQIRIDANKLETKNLKDDLYILFVDNFNSPAGEAMKQSFSVECYWGNKVGERRDLYYCAGLYNAPELDETQVIKRHIWKDFKIGFSVEEHNVGTWVDSSGKVHNEGSVFYLTVKTVDAKCSVGTANNKPK